MKKGVEELITLLAFGFGLGFTIVCGTEVAKRVIPIQPPPVQEIKVTR